MISHAPDTTNRVSISDFSWVQFYDALYSYLKSRPHHKNSRPWVPAKMYDTLSEEEKSRIIRSYLYLKAHHRAAEVKLNNPYRCRGNLTDEEADHILHFLHVKKGQSLLLRVVDTISQETITTAMYNSCEITIPHPFQPRNINHAEKQLCEDKAKLINEIQNKCSDQTNLKFQMFMNNSPCKLCSKDLKSILEKLSKELPHVSIEISVHYIWPYGLEMDKKGLLKMISHSPDTTNRVSISDFSWVQFYDALYSYLKSRPHHKNFRSWVPAIIHDIMSEEEKSALIVSYLYQMTHQRAVGVTMDVTNKTYDWNAKNIYNRSHVSA